MTNWKVIAYEVGADGWVWDYTSRRSASGETLFFVEARRGRVRHIVCSDVLVAAFLELRAQVMSVS